MDLQTLVRRKTIPEEGNWILLVDNLQKKNLKNRKLLPNPDFLCSQRQKLKKVILKMTGGRLTEIQLIEIVFYHLIEILLITWPKF